MSGKSSAYFDKSRFSNTSFTEVADSKSFIKARVGGFSFSLTISVNYPRLFPLGWNLGRRKILTRPSSFIFLSIFKVTVFEKYRNKIFCQASGRNHSRQKLFLKKIVGFLFDQSYLRPLTNTSANALHPLHPIEENGKSDLLKKT